MTTSLSHKSKEFRPTLPNYNPTSPITAGTSISRPSKETTSTPPSKRRVNNHFYIKVAETNDAIGAVDESLGLLAQLQNPSLVQIKKIQSNLVLLEKKLNGHTTFGPLVKALLELATEGNFSDQGAVKEVQVLKKYFLDR